MNSYVIQLLSKDVISSDSKSWLIVHTKIYSARWEYCKDCHINKSLSILFSEFI